MSSTRRRAGQLCAIAVVAGLALASSHVALLAGAEDRYAGRPVADVLRELQGAGLKLIFTSHVVPPALRVKSEPTSQQPRDIAAEILAPHGLVLRDGPRGTLLVVAGPRSSRPSPGRPQHPQPRDDQAPAQPPGREPPDAIRLEEHVEVIERVGQGDMHQPVYQLDSQAVLETAGAFENVLHAIRVLPGVAAIDDELGRVAVRGAGPEHNLVVLDGVQIHNPLRYGEFTSSFLNPATASRVTLDASGLDALYGGRLSSVTAIETRDGARDRKFAVSGSLGLASGDVLFEGRLPKTVSGSWWLTRSVDAGFHSRSTGQQKSFQSSALTMRYRLLGGLDAALSYTNAQPCRSKLSSHSSHVIGLNALTPGKLNLMPAPPSFTLTVAGPDLVASPVAGSAFRSAAQRLMSS